MSKIVDAIPNLLDDQVWIVHSNPGRAQAIINSSAAVLITANLYKERNQIAIHVREKRLKGNCVFTILDDFSAEKVLVAFMTGVGKPLSEVAEIEI